jgi:threonine/homoserine/homoserine lactone efflux protein
MRDLEGLVLFAIVSTGTPGPNNVLLWTSGLQFGFRATIPQIFGTSAGIGALAVAVAAGLGIVVTGLF